MALQKPLRIAVSSSLMALPEIQALAKKGHTVEWLPALSDYDLVLAEVGWYMTPEHAQYVEVAEKAARKRRYPKEAK